MKNQQNGGPVDEEGYPQGTKLLHMIVRLVGFTHREDKRFWRTMKSLVDGPLMGSKIVDGRGPEQPHYLESNDQREDS